MAMIISDQNGYAGMKNIWSMALSASMTTAAQRATWLPASTPAAASNCRMPMIRVIQPQVRRSPNT